MERSRKSLAKRQQAHLTTCGIGLHCGKLGNESVRKFWMDVHTRGRTVQISICGWWMVPMDGPLHALRFTRFDARSLDVFLSSADP